MRRWLRCSSLSRSSRAEPHGLYRDPSPIATVDRFAGYRWMRRCGSRAPTRRGRGGRAISVTIVSFTQVVVVHVWAPQQGLVRSQLSTVKGAAVELPQWRALLRPAAQRAVHHRDARMLRSSACGATSGAARARRRSFAPRLAPTPLPRVSNGVAAA
jgi:hypothetical protein